MRIQFTLALIVLNLGVFGYIYYLEKKTGPEDLFNKHIANVLPNALVVDRITIVTQGEASRETRTLERRRNRWEITSPFRWPANDNAIQRILTQLQFLDIDTIIPVADIERSGQSLADFGLESPQITLTYAGAGSETSLSIGAPTKLGSRLYVLAPGGKDVLVVSRELLESIDVSLDNLRSPLIFSLPIFEIRSLRIQAGEQGEQRIVLQKTGDRWSFESPIAVPADPEMVVNTLGMLASSQAFAIIPVAQVDRSRMGLTTPFMRVTLSGNERRETLVIGGRVPGQPEDSPRRYAQLESPSADGTVFTLNAENFEWLVNATDELRERRFFTFDPTVVTAIRITQGDQRLSLQKLEKRSGSTTDTWQVMVTTRDGSILTQPADTPIVEDLLEHLAELSARGFVSDAPSPANLTTFGFTPPNASVTLENGQSMTLLLGGVDREDPRLIYAKRGSQDYVYTIPSRILARISANPLAFRNRIMERQPPSASITRLHLKDLKTGTDLLDQAIDPARQTWPTALESMPENKREAVLSLISRINTFTVDNYLYPNFKEEDEIPWRYQLTAEILHPGGESGTTLTRNYFFTFRSEANRQIGGSPDTDLTFTLTQPFIDDLFTLTFMQETPSLPENPAQVEATDLDPLPAPAPEAPATPEDE